MPNMDINAEIQAIRDAFEGREVRTSIVEALEAVQTEVNNLAPAVLLSGTQVITIEDPGAYFIQQKLTLPFTPNSNTRMIATYRQNRSADEDRRVDIDECFKLVYDSGEMYAIVTADTASQRLGFNTFPPGTYYIDWLVLERGV